MEDKDRVTFWVCRECRAVFDERPPAGKVCTNCGKKSIVRLHLGGRAKEIYEKRTKSGPIH